MHIKPNRGSIVEDMDKQTVAAFLPKTPICCCTYLRLVYGVWVTYSDFGHGKAGFSKSLYCTSEPDDDKTIEATDLAYKLFLQILHDPLFIPDLLFEIVDHFL